MTIEKPLALPDGRFRVPIRTWELMSEPAQRLWHEMANFLIDVVLPAEADYTRQRHANGPESATVPTVVEDLKKVARERGLWNLFLSDVSGLSQLEYSTIAELSGWSKDLAPEAINGQAPDTGNMELLHLFGTPEQKDRWLAPLLDGTIRSAFAMTERNVASSDATNIETRIAPDGDDYVVSGLKWWTSGAADPRCEFLIVMGKTDVTQPRHRQQSMIIVPVSSPGVRILRSVPVFGHHDQHGHCEIALDDVRVPAGNLLGEEGAGFAMAQARLGPGRIHHCMRALGAAERAIELMVARATSRVAFGKPLAEQGMVHQQIAEARIAVDQARLLCHEAARSIDTDGNKASASLISMAKVAVPRAVTSAVDSAIQIHGAAGVSDDLPLATMYGWHRAMRLFDGPDEVHLRSIALSEVRRDR